MTFAPTCFGSRRNHHQGAVLCLAKTTNVVFIMLVGIDVVNVMAAYQPVVRACGSRWRKELSTDIPAQQADMPDIPDDGSCVNRNMSEQMSQFCAF